MHQCVDLRRKLPNRRSIDEKRHRGLDVKCLFNGVEDRRGEKRIASQVEISVLNADAIHAQDRSPNLRQLLLGWRMRRLVGLWKR